MYINAEIFELIKYSQIHFIGLNKVLNVYPGSVMSSGRDDITDLQKEIIGKRKTDFPKIKSFKPQI